MTRWQWRGNVGLLGVSLAFVLYPLLPNFDVVNSDWPAFATGAKLIVSDPTHLYDLDYQRRVQDEVTGGRRLVSLGIKGILPFLAPAWVALLAVPFDLLGTNLGGRAWILFELLCLAAGLYLVTRPRPPTELLPAFAGVPTAIMLLNAQLDGVVALGLGAALSLWSRPYLAGLALGLTLVKPQLVLPIGAALLLSRSWKVLAGWAAAGFALLGVTLIMSPRWVVDWLAQTRSTVQTGAREVNIAHASVLLPGPVQTMGLIVLTLAAIAIVVLIAWRCRDDRQAAAAALVAGGVFAAPHALSADLVLVALALAIWGRARWFDWLLLSAGTLLAALTPAPLPMLLGVVIVGWVVLRAAGLFTSRWPAPASASTR